MLKEKLIPSIIVVLMAIGMFVGYRVYVNSQTQKGEKEITIKVVYDDEVKKEVTFKTDQEFLGNALDEQELIQTKNSSFGRYVIGVNGKLADDSEDSWFRKILELLHLVKDETVAKENNEYWAIYINDQYAQYGIDDQPIVDGDVITFKLEKVEDAAV